VTASTVYLVRHGAHDRLGRTLCGRDDTVLNGDGLAQAEWLGSRFARLGVDVVQSSPLSRATATAEPIVRATGRPLAVEGALNELDFGQWTGATFESLADQSAWRWWNEDRGRRRPPGGETMLEMQVRIAGWLDGLRDKAVALVGVSHSDVIKSAVCYVLGLPLHQYDRFEIDPGSVTTIIVADWGMKLQSMNERPGG
jgi:broad specificity phosphatase PhoE